MYGLNLAGEAYVCFTRIRNTDTLTPPKLVFPDRRAIYCVHVAGGQLSLMQWGRAAPQHPPFFLQAAGQPGAISARANEGKLASCPKIQEATLVAQTASVPWGSCELCPTVHILYPPCGVLSPSTNQTPSIGDGNTSTDIACCAPSLCQPSQIQAFSGSRSRSAHLGRPVTYLTYTGTARFSDQLSHAPAGRPFVISILELGCFEEVKATGEWYRSEQD
ncbi:predicted protein [Coccidioides posadasii str. Silveira]|uniref:Predicted protein n=2 Tax=Coccidioides posadasii TaxID=199306 RepID=E9CZN6_COCPS|nr:predicted protein [Coccidioides posadasii str. Silveira]KMM73296.1 hypothetical protein CPAG_09585 [Coccidioides posadasii RMSCC 3488]